MSQNNNLFQGNNLSQNNKLLHGNAPNLKQRYLLATENDESILEEHCISRNPKSPVVGLGHCAGQLVSHWRRRSWRCGDQSREVGDEPGTEPPQAGQAAQAWCERGEQGLWGSRHSARGDSPVVKLVAWADYGGPRLIGRLALFAWEVWHILAGDPGGTFGKKISDPG